MSIVYLDLQQEIDACQFEHTLGQIEQGWPLRDQVAKALKHANAAFSTQCTKPNGYTYMQTCDDLVKFLDLKIELEYTEQESVVNVLQVACAMHENAVNNPSLTAKQRLDHHLATTSLVPLCKSALEGSVTHPNLRREVATLVERAENSFTRATDALDLSRFLGWDNASDDDFSESGDDGATQGGTLGTPPYDAYPVAYCVQSLSLSDDCRSYDTVLKRWPVIITSIIDHVHRLIHDMTMEAKRLAESSEDTLEHVKALEDKIEEGKEIISKASRLKYRMARDQELEPIPEDGDVDIDTYNAELANLATTHQDTWFTAPWLFAECVVLHPLGATIPPHTISQMLSVRSSSTMFTLTGFTKKRNRYRLFRSYFNETRRWCNFDPFFAQKEDMFKHSATAIYQIATSMHELEHEKERLRSNPDNLLLLFREMIQMCLWGNATDLSLLTHLKPSDIEDLQTVLGKDAQLARQAFILKDDQEAVWEYIKTLGGSGKRCDFILDNAGFELFTDLVFADFLVTYTPYFSKVVFHPKLFPWFVSDVTPTDFESTITSLLSTTFFPEALLPDTRSTAHLQEMVMRWRSYLEQGTFVLSTDITEVNGQKVDGKAMVKFWTEPWPYWNMKERASQLWGWLHDSDLVVFKSYGDNTQSNERLRLTGDVMWPVSTPFTTALGPLAGAFPLLSLRTNKADIAVGIPQEIADELDRKGEKWRVSGK
ncbi:hypothetical protein JVT61DRAFT_11124 [Boletus reticuloceps]|uniref:Damage-control phosphatase ARMT1-like metal-binding domain-containing protein n=1 Tax=Boletus reticuloceps TaxID=495285 RepID=A0A8I2YF52_9AGAM|nr:hypothetical protein JVT61DRAFT_11124 [Boletus reticuloceps]